MAKGQKKSNKEVRKPKAEKVKAAPATAGLPERVEKPNKIAALRGV